MGGIKKISLVLVALGVFNSVGLVAGATEETKGLVISPSGTFQSLSEAIAQASNGDTLNVYGGTHVGPIVIDKSLTLIGHEWPVLDGENKGTVAFLTAPGIVLNGFLIKNSGAALSEENSALTLEAPGILVEGNRIEETLFGIYLKKASNSIIRDNVIHSKSLALPRRGDPIRVWFSHDVLIEDNKVEEGRDVVLWYSERLRVRGNDISGGRYGLHFMYCDDAIIEKNRLANNSVGAFLMYSRHLKIHNNVIVGNRGPSGFGIGMKDMDDVNVKGNLFSGNRIGVSVDNSPREIDSSIVYEGNLLSLNDVGVKFMPSVRQNYFTGNSFNDNQEHVSISGGGKFLSNSWTVDGVGNYWSDYTGFDEDLDGIGDIPYKSHEFIENLMGKHPALRLFLYSPVSQAVKFGAEALPIVQPRPKLADEAPLMALRMPENLPGPPSPPTSFLGLASGGMLMAVSGLFFFPFSAIGRTKSMAASKSKTGNAGVRVSNLRKQFGTNIVIDDLSFNVSEGESVAIWGSNGVGKTTILHCLLGLLAYEGSAKINDLEVREKGKAIRTLVGFVPQELNLHEDLTVFDTMRLYSRLRKLSEGLIERRLDQFGLLEHSRKRVGHLSGGLKRKLALALALLSDPPILILDEPTAGLDTESRASLLSIVSTLKKNGRTLIFASHRRGDVLGLADRILIIEEGKLSKIWTPDQMTQHDREAVQLRIYLPSEQLSIASDILTTNGFASITENSAILVDSSLVEKAKPITLLAEAGLSIRDFDVEPTPEAEGEST